jgi:hypothetical protein
LKTVSVSRRFSYAVDDVATLAKPVNHVFDDIDVVLEVGIDTDQRIAVGREQAGDEGVLMSAVTRQLDPHDWKPLPGKPVDEFPSPVAAPVIDEINSARVGNLSGGDESGPQLEQAPAGLGKDLLFVEAWDHDAESRHLLSPEVAGPQSTPMARALPS